MYAARDANAGELCELVFSVLINYISCPVQFQLIFLYQTGVEGYFRMINEAPIVKVCISNAVK